MPATSSRPIAPHRAQDPAALPARRSLRLAGILAALVLAAVACASPAPSTPPPTEPGPTSVAGASGPPAASPTPSRTLSPEEIEALIAEIAASVAPIRQLEPTADVPDRIIDEAGLRTELQRLIEEAATPEEYAADARLGEHLGLLPPGTDLAAIQLELLGDQVLGFYDEERDDLAVVQRGTAFGPLERTTFAHEFTHALQDQRFDLGRIQPDDLDESDPILARVALVEGDASLLTQQWALGNLTFAEILEMTRAALDPAQLAALERVPPIVARQLEFPYLEGLAFADALYQRGGWAAVDEAYDRLPESTEQIIHPEKYLAAEPPVAVAAPVTPDDLGEGWTEARVDTLGELGISVWLEPTAGAVAAADAAAGWGGDRVVLLEGPDDGWLLAWATSWDTPADADAFSAAAASRVTELGTPATIVHTPGSTEVEVRAASVGELLRAGD